jgi:alpha-ketoglutarate-dependent taurine dioxygenase
MSVAKQSEIMQATSDKPFDLSASEAYEHWKNDKLVNYPSDVEQIIVRLEDPYELKASEKAEIARLCSLCNVAIYQIADTSQNDKSLVHELGKQFGLRHLDSNLRADEDSVTSLQVRDQTGNQYIPYTNKPLSWHTDGYYNEMDQQIRAIIMHCVNPASEGGENGLLDHEMLYIRLRDENPAWIEALMHPAAMTIPPNIEQGEEIRGAQAGPVFSVDESSGSLHMRYSARKRNIEWRDDPVTLEAATRITELLEDESMVFRHQLQAGQGVICNNILHNRTVFSEMAGQKRLMYRARYYDRIANTGLDTNSGNTE